VTPRQAVAFVRKHGVVLESAAGPVPSLAVAIAGGPSRGNWWAHPRSHEIFKVTRAVRDSEDILVCRVVDGKVTYVHRDLWPALVRLAGRFDPDRLAWLHEVHTDSGAHRVDTEPFPDWVPSGVRVAAAALSEEEAAALLGGVAELYK